MSYYPSYVPGEWKCECMVCGRVFKASKIRKRWDGLLVCKDDFEPKHEQLRIQARKDDQRPDFAFPDPEGGMPPADYEVSQDKTNLTTYKTDLENVTDLPSSSEAGDRVWYQTTGQIMLSNGTAWFYSNGLAY